MQGYPGQVAPILTIMVDCTSSAASSARSTRYQGRFSRTGQSRGGTPCRENEASSSSSSRVRQALAGQVYFSEKRGGCQ
eukprot:1544410-Pyramimonas_sp.AAC.1